MSLKKRISKKPLKITKPVEEPVPDEESDWFAKREGTELSVVGAVAASRWKETIHDYQMEKVIYQNESFKMVPASLRGLDTITLTPYQRTTVYTMCELEQRRWLKLRVGDDNVHLYFTMGRVTEMVGAGKTMEFIGLHLRQKYPKITDEARAYNAHVRPEKYCGRTSIVQIRYEPARIIKSTLVFVGAAVLEQWVDTIATLTDLRYFVCRDKKDFHMLIDKIMSGGVNKYDFVIAKNGHITGTISWPEGMTVMDKNKISSPYMYNALSGIYGYTWARLIMDDMDTIGMPYNASSIPALFTWIASSTNNMRSMNKTHNSQFASVDDILRCSTYGYWRYLRNQTLGSILNVTSSETYIKKNNGLAPPMFFVYIFENEHDTMIGLIGNIDDGLAREIQELLNNDDFGAASARAGIQSNSVADIFSSLLGKKYADYIKAEKMLAFLETIPEDHRERLPIKQNPDKKDKYFTKERLFTFETPEYNYPNLKSLLATVREEQQKIFDENGKAVDRVKDNIRHGTCPICKIGLDGEDIEIFILTCCGAVNCAACAIEVLGIGKVGKQNTGYHYGPPKKGTLSSTCTKCRRDINIKNLIYVGKNIRKTNISEKFALTLEEIEHDEARGDVDEDEDEDEDEKKHDEDEDEDDGEDDGDAESEPEVDADGKPIRITKVKAIVKICSGFRVKLPCEEVECKVERLMDGFSQTLPPPEYRKVLVFSQVRTALAEVAVALKKKKIKFWRLQGSAKDLSTIARKYNTYAGNAVLLILSEKLCAGLNLQPTSHIVMYGFIPNLDILAQALGRGQRLGRKSILKIIFLAYQNEYSLMKDRIGLIKKREVLGNDML